MTDTNVTVYRVVVKDKPITDKLCLVPITTVKDTYGIVIATVDTLTRAKHKAKVFNQSRSKKHSIAIVEKVTVYTKGIAL